VIADLHPHALASDPDRLQHLFGAGSELLPLWIAEPYVDLAPAVVQTLATRAGLGWYGYESRPQALQDTFWRWMKIRHSWDGSNLHTSISPSVGTSIGVLLELFTEPGEGVILQPPVFTDFKPLVISSNRSVVRNPLELTGGRYEMDFDDLVARAADPNTTAMILCNPHNPVGRLWAPEDLRTVAGICAANDVFVIADEIHADLTLATHAFTPFATAAEGSGARWAATHGPIKTFGLAGVCDTLLITDDEQVTMQFRGQSSRLHLTRNNVFGMAAFEAAYRQGAEWLDGLLGIVDANLALLAAGLPDPISLVLPEATYLAWIDFRGLGLGVPDLARWLAEAGVALSPGHWFGRQGAGFARMTVAAPPAAIEKAIDRFASALA
jgi:cystathionine beta-lyase